MGSRVNSPYAMSLLLLALLALANCSDSRREAFIQSKCGKLALAAESYEKCRELMGEGYDRLER